jgi:hypothetical protein
VSRRGRWAALRHGELPAPKARWRSPPTPEIRPATQARGSEGESSWRVRMIKLSVRSRPLGHRDGPPDPERRWDAPLCRCPSWGHHLLSDHIEVPDRHRRPRGACTAALTTSAALAPVSGCHGREVKCMRGQR